MGIAVLKEKRVTAIWWRVRFEGKKILMCDPSLRGRNSTYRWERKYIEQQKIGNKPRETI